ncbi:glycosyltransferase family 4 protein [Bacteroides acidifaciens]|uniref:glycosyltransferase family 4 protein n=1 Tax=Bacteroides acidifaciens TaxID=85831 RepID=UPI000F4755A2|nr:glycosyltransferase family 4 protein [Bacteroides acidifaciens]ROT17584.1 glycosyltransferase family 1 protein [Muribaculaceae bacterium Isolate-110 (HZI)]
MSRVLVVATSRKTRGGITSVIKAHETGEQWKKFHCHWVQTHRDGPAWRKVLYFITGMADFLIRLPFYDIVHIHTADYGTEKRKRIFAKLTKLFGKKLIVHLHSSGPEFSIGGMYRDLYKYSFTHADKVILLSNTWKQEAIKAFHLPDDKMVVLYNPCPVVKPSSIEEREAYILFAGTLTHRKGYDDLIKAFARMASKYPKWRLKLAGNGEIEQGKALTRELGIENQVDFLGWVNGEEKDNAFRHASVYCLPSYSEGFPMGVLDAWAYHLPVVTTPVGGIPDVGLDGKNVLLFSPGDINGLAHKLDELICNHDCCFRLQAASETFATINFNIKTISHQLGLIYKSILK